jgi:mycoredoxin
VGKLDVMAEPIVVYGADWCGDCIRAKRVLDGRGVDYRWIDLEARPDKAEEARRIGRSARIPVVAFPDGTVMVEPSTDDLESRLT